MLSYFVGIGFRSRNLSPGYIKFLNCVCCDQMFLATVDILEVLQLSLKYTNYESVNKRITSLVYIGKNLRFL